MTEPSIDEYSSPLRKLVSFFRRSRDSWKTKHRDVKSRCKLLQNQNRAVERSRESWRERATAAEQELEQLRREVDELKRRRTAA